MLAARGWVEPNVNPGGRNKIGDALRARATNVCRNE